MLGLSNDKEGEVYFKGMENRNQRILVPTPNNTPSIMGGRDMMDMIFRSRDRAKSRFDKKPLFSETRYMMHILVPT